MRVDEYSRLDGMALADLVRRGEVAAREVHATAREAMLELDKQLAFLVAETPTEASRALEGDLPPGPFMGVPTLVKDIGPKIAGIPQELGSALAAGLMPSTDSEIIRRYRASGLVFMGRTSTPEFGASFTTEPKVGPVTRNPWDPSRSPGGSSGGAAAAVASGVVPIALGGDSGGSIRVPAHCCGLFGLKPSRGRNPTGPDAGEVNSGLTAAHVLTRSVRDSAAALDATAGPDLGCRYAAAPPPRPFAESVDAEPGRLRLAISTTNVFGGPVDSDIRQLTAETGKLCESLGHVVEEAEPPFDGDELIDLLHVIWSANIHHLINHLERATGRRASAANLEATSLLLHEAGALMSADRLLSTFDGVNRVTRRVAGFFGDYDALITPSFSSAAPYLGELQATGLSDAREHVRESMARAPFTAQYNLTGLPAMSVPLHLTAGGLPVGTHFAAAYGREEMLFALAGQLERASPWRERIPPIHVGTHASLQPA